MKLKNIAVASALVAGSMLAVQVSASPTVTAVGSADFTGLSGNPNYGYLSSDGSMLLGSLYSGNSQTLYYWAQSAQSPTLLNDYYYSLNPMTSDGSKVVVSGMTGGGYQILLTATGTLVNIATPASNPNGSLQAQTITSDGSVMVGSGYEGVVPKVYLWNNPQGTGANITYTASTLNAYSVSGTDYYTTMASLNGDGSLALAYAIPSGQNVQSSQYIPVLLNTSTNAYETLNLGSYVGGVPRLISNDGLKVFGSLYASQNASMPQNVLWSRANTGVAFGAPTSVSSFASYTDAVSNTPSSMSKDGTYLGGSVSMGSTAVAMIWRLSDGYYANVVGLSGYTNNTVRQITLNNRYVLGYATSPSTATTRYWIADIGANASALTFVAPNTVAYATPNPTPAPSNSVIDVSNTNISIANSAYRLNSVLNLQSMLQRLALDYDCNQFGENEMCFAAGGVRSVVTGEQTSANGVNLRIAKKISDTTHVGVFFDKAWNSSLPTGTQVNRSNPMVGLFAGYAENKNGTGISSRVSVGYATMGTTSVRNIDGLSDTEAGSGQANFRSMGAQVEGAFGMKVDDLLVEPYIGARYNSVRRNGYAESSGANYPVTYEKLAQGALTGLIGAKVSGQLSENIYVKANIRVEYDINRKYGDFNSSYADGSATVNISSTAMPAIKRTRLVPTIGADYVIDKSQRVNVSVSEQPLNVGKAVNAMATYMVGF